MIVNARFLSQPVTGVQRHAIEISQVLKRIRPDIVFVAPAKILNQKATDLLDPKVIGKHSGYYWEQIELPRYLRKHHQGELLVSLANMAPLNYGPQLVTIHDMAPLQHPEWYSRRFRTVYKFMIPRIARRAEIVLTDSEFSRNEINLATGLSKEKIQVVPCAVAEAIISAKPNGMDTERRPYILSVASLDPRKNLRRLLAAFAKLDLPDYRLVVVGAGNSSVFNSSDLGSQLEVSKNISFVGNANDSRLKGLYENAELFVYPSLYEGFGLPPLEAMACGCPCLVSHCPSLPEVCDDAVEYCDPYDTSDITAKMRSLLADKNKMNDLRKRGQRRAMQFSWTRSAERILEIAKEIAQK